jgi:hypothetical protein
MEDLKESKTISSTDLLLEIKEKQDYLIALCQNIDNNYKILLMRMNSPIFVPQVQQSSVQNIIPQTAQEQNKLQNGLKFIQPQDSMTPEQRNLENFKNRPKTNQFEQMAAEQGETSGASQNTVLATSSEMTEASKRSGKVRSQRSDPSEANNSKPNVFQELKLKDSEGNVKPLFMAMIEVIDADNVTVKTSRTDPKGRWIAPLAPGKYTIHVMKSTANIDYKYDVFVEPSSKPLNLGEKIIN